MPKTICTLTVFFEDPYWVGLYERTCDGRLEVCKITFGAEPKDAEVYQYLLKHGATLRFSPPVRADTQPTGGINPKRRQRQIQRALERPGIGTKAQQALGAQRAAGKEARRQKTRAQKQAEQRERFTRRQQKRKEKHRGH